MLEAVFGALSRDEATGVLQAFAAKRKGAIAEGEEANELVMPIANETESRLGQTAQSAFSRASQCWETAEGKGQGKRRKKVQE